MHPNYFSVHSCHSGFVSAHFYFKRQLHCAIPNPLMVAATPTSMPLDQLDRLPPLQQTMHSAATPESPSLSLFPGKCSGYDKSLCHIFIFLPFFAFVVGDFPSEVKFSIQAGSLDDANPCFLLKTRVLSLAYRQRTFPPTRSALQIQFNSPPSQHPTPPIILTFSISGEVKLRKIRIEMGLKTGNFPYEKLPQTGIWPWHRN